MLPRRRTPFAAPQDLSELLRQQEEERRQQRAQKEKERQMMNRLIEIVHGHEMGVMETWHDGVVDKVFSPKMYILFPGFSKHMYEYDTSSRVFVMNNKDNGTEKGEGREKDAYTVQSREGQDMTISLNLRWHIDPTKLVDIHKRVRSDIEEKLIRPVVMRVVKDEATACTAIDAYSGEGLVKLQKSIQQKLMDPMYDLAVRGIVVENFVIEGIDLDPNYINEIKQKQIATQTALKAAEQQKAAEALALKAKADAQADFNKQIVEAERDKQKGILASEMSKQQEILAAEAEKQKKVLTAEGERDANIALAAGIVAVGEAEAKAATLRYTAFSAPGIENYVKIEVSKSLASAFQNVKGLIPSDMKFTMFSESYMKALDELVTPAAAATAIQAK